MLPLLPTADGRECDQEIEKHLGTLPSRPPEAAQAGEAARCCCGKRKQAAGNTPSSDLAGELVQIAGADFHTHRRNQRTDGADHHQRRAGLDI